MTTKLKRLHEAAMAQVLSNTEVELRQTARMEYEYYLRLHGQDFIALIEAARTLRASCDTVHKNADGTQMGVRNPDRHAVIALAKALQPFEDEK